MSDLRFPFRRFSIALALGVFAAKTATPADTNEQWLAEHYTKYEYRIPMRDGVHLFTRVYVPKDDSQRWPIILTRTPYALKPYGDDNYSSPGSHGSFRILAEDRFIFATQDVRGRYGSEGQYVHVRPFNPNKGPAARMFWTTKPNRSRTISPSPAPSIRLCTFRPPAPTPIGS